MKIIPRICVPALALSLAFLLRSAEDPRPGARAGLSQAPQAPAAAAGQVSESQAPKAKEPAGAASKPEGGADRAALEEKFKKLLTNSVFVGRWCLVQDGKLGEEKEEKYTIQSANKAGEDLWIIFARIQYGQKDVLVPVPVQVKWAGDTPVISITNLGIPGLGTYTARVVVYDNAYAGTWSAPDHGGQLHGIITKPEQSAP